nr:ubiquitin-like protein 7 [Onthophagus taurus]
MGFGNISLGVRVKVSEYERIEIDNYNLEETVDSFKNEVIKQIGVEKDSIVLMYAGVDLEDDKSLSSCGIKPGVMIHVLSRPKPKQPQVNKEFSDAELEQLVVAFKAFMLSPWLNRTALQRLSRPELLDMIKAATPGLSEDLVACALIQDPDLLVQLSDISIVRTMATKHPTVIDAAKYIAAHLHNVNASIGSSNRPSTSSGYSYSLEALSDEDNDMESNNETPRETGRDSGNPLTRNTSYGAITAAQLADAILNSTQNVNFGTTPSRSNIITNEMFSNAIQQAFASNPTSNTSLAGNLTSTEQNPTENSGIESQSNLLVRLQPQLQQMREMGLMNEAVNIRALQVTSGDVQAAVELVFNGIVD